MNSEEATSMAKMAVTVLLVVLVIGAVVSLVYAAYNWFSSGTDRLADTVTSIDKSQYSQFDDKQVSGSNVLSALKQYRDSNVCVFIDARGDGDAAGGDWTGKRLVSVNSSLTGWKVDNYCALTSEAAGGTEGAAAADTVPQAILYGKDDGTVWFDKGLAIDTTDNVTIKRNTNFSPTTNQGKKANYVKQTAKFYAKLVYDNSTGEIAGIVFEQLNQ